MRTSSEYTVFSARDRINRPHVAFRRDRSILLDPHWPSEADREGLRWHLVGIWLFLGKTNYANQLSISGTMRFFGPVEAGWFLSRLTFTSLACRRLPRLAEEVAAIIELHQDNAHVPEHVLETLSICRMGIDLRCEGQTEPDALKEFCWRERVGQRNMEVLRDLLVLAVQQRVPSDDRRGLALLLLRTLAAREPLSGEDRELIAWTNTVVESTLVCHPQGPARSGPLNPGIVPSALRRSMRVGRKPMESP